MLACTTGVFGALIGIFYCLFCSGNKKQSWKFHIIQKYACATSNKLFGQNNIIFLIYILAVLNRRVAIPLRLFELQNCRLP